MHPTLPLALLKQKLLLLLSSELNAPPSWGAFFTFFFYGHADLSANFLYLWVILFRLNQTRVN
jgi:hypothetical protein